MTRVSKSLDSTEGNPRRQFRNIQFGARIDNIKIGKYKILRIKRIIRDIF